MVKKPTHFLLAVAVAFGGLTIAGGVSSSQALAASLPNCNKSVIVPFPGSQWIEVPVYQKGSSVTYKCIVGTPTSGFHVEAIQRAARTCYGLSLGPYGVDGKMGAYTTAAIKAIQKNVGVSQDGIYGPQTHNGSSGIAGKTGMVFYPYCWRDTRLT
ncbi:MAG: peptidoglycan-binding protein [Bifidobacteriaceae bacterium]|jgi:peptidoglycan hydrolase-like protein with peptidoglycan-binding domain|nr:peptidoglycan-binding protein [Bifidobacteriaceae bacterium]